MEKKKKTKTKWKMKCQRCKKNKASLQYAKSILDFTHGFVEYICEECYDKEKKSNPWYIAGKNELIDDEIEFLTNLLQNENQKELSKARTQDTGRKTIPDMYDMKIKERIKQLKEMKENAKEKES